MTGTLDDEANASFRCKGYRTLDVTAIHGLNHISRVSCGRARVFIVRQTSDIVVVDGHRVDCVERSVGPLCCKQSARLVVVLRLVCVANCSRQFGSNQPARNCVVQSIPDSRRRPLWRAEDGFASCGIAIRLAVHAQGEG